MKRIILIISLGFILGIIMGLYLNIVPFVFLTIIILLIISKIFKVKYECNFIRIINIFIQNNALIIIFVSAFISSTYIINCSNEYNYIYKNFSLGKCIAIVVSNEEETEYKEIYKIKLIEFNNKRYNKYFLLEIPKYKAINYGDKIEFYGEYVIPEQSRNYKGFDYSNYLKTQNIYGKFKTDNVCVLKENSLNVIRIYSNYIKQKIIENSNKILTTDTRQLFLGIMIGYTDRLQENLQEEFEKSSLTHLLAVSGAHIVYIIIGLEYLLKKLNIYKQLRNIITILFLLLFMYITEFSPSVTRAVIMGIISLIPILLNKKQDTLSTISMSILLILINNPYKIFDIGLILSYFATIGIIMLVELKKEDDKGTNTDKSLILKVYQYLIDIILITVIANIFVIPIMMYNFNTISFTFVISNLVAGLIIGPITIGGFVIIISSFINIKIAYLLSLIYNFFLRILISSTNLVSKVPFSQLFVPTISKFSIITYYIFLSLISIYKSITRKNSNRYLSKKMIIFIKYILVKLKNKKIILISFIIVIFLVSQLLKMFPRNLKIYFIDVGQGDCSLIITPTNKKVLIDSGGSETGNFDIGKNVLLPYLLDRGITEMDYICISHFDSDHCKGFIYLLNNIKVKNIIISKQSKNTENLKNILNIVQSKKINTVIVKKGDILQIDKYVLFKILNPDINLENDINDNSIVMKLEYFNFSCLFTGDISKSVEEKLIDEYSIYLKSDILKIAHHGSSNSLSENFIDVVSPKISLIGVEKNNKFRTSK